MRSGARPYWLTLLHPVIVSMSGQQSTWTRVAEISPNSRAINKDTTRSVRRLWNNGRSNFIFIAPYILTILINPTRCNYMQYLFTAKLLYMFRVSPNPSSGAHKNCNRSFWYRSCNVSGQRLSVSVVYKDHAGGRSLPWYLIWPIPEAAVTVLCAPDDGCGDTWNM
jgi:hypothetical protein